jgi:hypothetical protein
VNQILINRQSASKLMGLNGFLLTTWSSQQSLVNLVEI